MNPRRSGAAAIAAIAVLAALAAPACDRGAGPDSEPPEPSATHSAPQLAPPRVSIRFVDRTAPAGIAFRHTNGAYGSKLLPETCGSGAGCLDYDGDGHLDLFFVNSRYWPGHEPPGAVLPACALYRGRGDGTFEDVTAESGAGVSLYGMGCAVADYDGDGDDDVYVTGLEGNILLRNDGGHFADATAFAGVGGGHWRDRAGDEHPEWSTAAAWLDADGDEDLDLFVANYVQWTADTDVFTTIDGVHKVFTTPDRYRGLPCRLFANRGDGTFEDRSAAAGLLDVEGKALGVALWDFDDNGFLDIAVANDTRPNFLFMAERGALREMGLALEVAYDQNGRARAGMGIDVADYANDGVPGIAIGNFSQESISLYRRGSGGRFTSAAAAAGLERATFEPLAFGLLFRDFDLDGLQDLVIANGHIEPDIARYFPSQRYEQPPQLFLGVAGGRFVEATERAGEDFRAPRAGRGLLAADFDEDGDLDLVLTSNGSSAVLLSCERTGVPAHFLRVRLEQPGGNRRAIGARVLLEADGLRQTRTMRTGSSYVSESEATLTFGLGGTLPAAASLHVRWPDGRETAHQVGAFDTTITIARP
ncbi:MAG: CRTAC1 family protein [Planctomycetes bacterium]|nr:CRTAC1 family protein [Planctomycetota bacterium]